MIEDLPLPVFPISPTFSPDFKEKVTSFNIKGECSEYFKNKNNTHYTSLGASGAVNALIFSFITLYSKLSYLYLFDYFLEWE